jgi:hypothetical protein
MADTTDARGAFSWPIALFPYERAAGAYAQLEWQWAGLGVPDAWEIRNTVDALAWRMRDSVAHEAVTGGLRVWKERGEVFVSVDERLEEAMRDG